MGFWGCGIEEVLQVPIAKALDPEFAAFGTTEKLSTSELPRPPVPITPIRTLDVALNGTSAILLADTCVRAPVRR